MIDLYKVKLEDMGLSVRSYNVLRRNNIDNAGRAAELTEEELLAMRNMGRKSMDEIKSRLEFYRSISEWPIETGENENSPDNEWVRAYLKERHTGIEVLEYLSPKAYNCLNLSGYTELWKIIDFSALELEKIPHVDEKTAREIDLSLSQYLEDNKSVFQNAYNAIKDFFREQTPDFMSMLKLPEYRNALLEYTAAHDKAIGELNLSSRPVNQLLRNGYTHLSEILFLTEEDLMQMDHMGKTSATQILDAIRQYILSSEKPVTALVSGDSSGFWSEADIRKGILSLYDHVGFSGLSFSDIQEKLEMGKSIPPEQLKKIIGGLIADRELEYVDYRCYMVYGHFADYIQSCPKLSDRNKTIIQKRLAGMSLEETGRCFDLTRERIRQIVSRDSQKIKKWYQYTTGKKWLDEEYYRYFYETYDFKKEDASRWMGMTEESWNYLDMSGCVRGTKALHLALEDTKNMDTGLRVRIRNFLNRNKIFVNGKWVDKKRSKLEKVVARKYCVDAVSFEAFCGFYNQFLQDEGIAYDPSLYYTDAVLDTRKNHVRDARYLLWSFPDHLRYYDIDSRDYTELLDELNLESYENIEISTTKFINENPEIMRRYDIRDQYELHNLLRKIIPSGSYHQMVIGKMPEITFGTFDREQAILELLCEHAPISTSDFADLLNREFGYDQATTIAGYLVPFANYCHRGIYDIDQKPMTREELTELKQLLTEDFYYVDEIRDLYAVRFPGGDSEKVNAYNLKLMGFTVLSKYVLQNFTSAEAFFKHILSTQDFTDITEIRKRYSRVVSFSNILMVLKRNLDIVEYEPNQVIRWSKLAASGMTREMIQKFCEDVWNFTEGQTYFNLKTIQDAGFDSELFDYGFSDWFYSNLLLSDPRFSYSMMYSAMIFYRGIKAISIQSFLVDLLQKKEKADMLDLMSELSDRYGCRKLDRSDITYKIAESEIYYDEILDRLYANVELYYQELEADAL